MEELRKKGSVAEERKDYRGESRMRGGESWKKMREKEKETERERGYEFAIARREPLPSSHVHAVNRSTS